MATPEPADHRDVESTPLLGEPARRHTPHGVVGLSGSPSSWHALAFGCGWARRTDAALTVVHVRRPLGVGTVDGYAAATLTELHDDVEANLAREVAQWMPPRSVRWRFVSLTGNPAHMLRWAADTLHADTIFVGRSHTRLRRHSVDDHLCRQAERVVITVP